MIKRSLLVIGLVCNLFAPAAFSEEKLDAGTLLEGMNTAFRTLNYELSYVAIEKGRITPMRYSHGLIDGKPVGHLLSLNGSPQEYLQRGDITSFYESEQAYSLKSVRIPGLLFSLIETDVKHAESTYNAVSVGGKSRITGRLSQVVRIVPNDKYRFGYLIWIDVASKLPLRVDMVTESGEVMYQIMAVSLYQYPSAPPWLDEINSSPVPPVLMMQSDDEKKQFPSDWKAAWIPVGFDMIASNKHLVAGIQQEVSYMQFSDGLVDVSIYVNDEPNKGSLVQGLGISGLISLQSKITEDVEIVVVGEVPAATAKKIADSVVKNIGN